MPYIEMYVSYKVSYMFWGGGDWMTHFFIYIVIKFFHSLISAATGAAAPGCSGTVNAGDYKVGLLGFHNAVCVVMGSFMFI